MRQIAKQLSEVTLGLIRAIPPSFGPLSLTYSYRVRETHNGRRRVAAVVK